MIMAKRNSQKVDAPKTDAPLAPVGPTAGDLAKAIERTLAQDANPKGSEGVNQEQTIKLLTVAQQAKVKEYLKDDKLVATLTKTDTDYCAQQAKSAADEVTRKGGYFDLKSLLEQSKTKLSNIPFEACFRAERAHPGDSFRQVAVRVAYYEAVMQEMEKQAQLQERKQRPEKDADGNLTDRTSTVPVKELLGDHWLSVKSKGKRALIAGLLPSEFTKATVFFQAALGKKGRKPGGATTIGEQANKGQATAAPQNMVAEAMTAAGFGPATTGAMAVLVKKLRETDIEADVEIAQLLMTTAAALAQYKAGVYVPDETTPAEQIAATG
jgi:hypothetical protein